MSERKSRTSRQVLGRARSVAKVSRPRSLPAAQAEELRQAIETLLDAVRTLGRKLDSELDESVVKPGAREGLAGVPGPARSAAIAETELAADNSADPVTAKSPPLSGRLRELWVLAPDGSGSTRVLPAHVPFDMRLALESSPDTNPPVFPVACDVSVRARRLGSGDGGMVVGEARQSIVSASETVNVSCEGLSTEGLYRFEATATLRGSDGASAPAFLVGSLVTVS